jgi:hypothetical protein
VLGTNLADFGERFVEARGCGRDDTYFTVPVDDRRQHRFGGIALTSIGLCQRLDPVASQLKIAVS